MSNEEFTDHQKMFLPVAEEIMLEGLQGQLSLDASEMYQVVTRPMSDEELEEFNNFVIDCIEGKKGIIGVS